MATNVTQKDKTLQQVIDYCKSKTQRLPHHVHAHHES